jgi:hypothetical protein
MHNLIFKTLQLKRFWQMQPVPSIRTYHEWISGKHLLILTQEFEENQKALWQQINHVLDSYH